MSELLKTPLDSLHRELEARMVPFAGYQMPLQYAAGILKEHQHTRESAGLFDVSHMGQLLLSGPSAGELLETLVAADVLGLNDNQQTYALFTNESGGVLDDLIITRWSEEQYFLVVNAACKKQDIAHLQYALAGQTLETLTDRALLALQGPAARGVMSQLSPQAGELTFMRGCHTAIDGVDAYITCSGYTGEDGFEISVAADEAERIARSILAFSEVTPVGLGARDSLRLEAGLCLYGHELDVNITPIQAGLIWSIAKVRRADGARAGGFPGADIIFQQIAEGVDRKRIGLAVQGKRPVREGQMVLDTTGNQVGEICSACFGASYGGPIAMAYVDSRSAAEGTELAVDARGKQLPVNVVKTPFVPQRYYRG